MGSRSAAAGAVETVVWSAMVASWYAMPDVIRSRAWRAALKVAIVGAAAGYSVVRYRADAAEAVADEADGPATGDASDGSFARVRTLTSGVPVLDAADLDLADDDERAGTDLVRAGGVAALATAGVIGSIAGTVAAERGLFRLGERWRAGGVAGAHTRIGLVAGVVTAVLALAADELERRTSAA